MNAGSCPYCKRIIASVRLEAITADAGPQSYHAVSYLCPHCSCVLSVEIDPTAQKNDTVSEIVEQVVQRLQD
jgi:transposase-like protein